MYNVIVLFKLLSNYSLTPFSFNFFIGNVPYEKVKQQITFQCILNHTDNIYIYITNHNTLKQTTIIYI